MPIGALGDAGRQVFALLRRLREELKVNTTCGLSNISFGLPHRHGINAAFIPMVIGAGMTSAIMNPCRPQEMEAVRGANVLTGTDEDCATWIKTYKDYKPAEAGQPAVGSGAVDRRGRRGTPPRRPRARDWPGDEELSAQRTSGRCLRLLRDRQPEPPHRARMAYATPSTASNSIMPAQEPAMPIAPPTTKLLARAGETACRMRLAASAPQMATAGYCGLRYQRPSTKRTMKKPVETAERRSSDMVDLREAIIVDR